MEGIHYLYAMNEFDTRSEYVVRELPHFLPRVQVDAIQSLTLCWTVRRPPLLKSPIKDYCVRGDFDQALKLSIRRNQYKKRWIQAWKTLAEMNGLTHLKLELNIIGRGYGWGERDDGWAASDLEIIKAVTLPQSIILVTGYQMATGLKTQVRAPNLTILGMLEEQYLTGT